MHVTYLKSLTIIVIINVIIITIIDNMPQAPSASFRRRRAASACCCRTLATESGIGRLRYSVLIDPLLCFIPHTTEQHFTLHLCKTKVIYENGGHRKVIKFDRLHITKLNLKFA